MAEAKGLAKWKKNMCKYLQNEWLWVFELVWDITCKCCGLSQLSCQRCYGCHCCALCSTRSAILTLLHRVAQHCILGCARKPVTKCTVVRAGLLPHSWGVWWACQPNVKAKEMGVHLLHCSECRAMCEFKLKPCRHQNLGYTCANTVLISLYYKQFEIAGTKCMCRFTSIHIFTTNSLCSLVIGTARQGSNLINSQHIAGITYWLDGHGSGQKKKKFVSHNCVHHSLL